MGVSEVKTMTSSKMLMIVLFTFLSLVAITHGECIFPSISPSGEVVNDKWEDCDEVGDRCIFPFTYKGVTYNTCTKTDSELAWCATEVHPSGTVVNNKWEDCDEVVETDLSSIFGPGHEGVVQRAVFRPRLNQTVFDVPAHGQNMALGIVIQGLGGRGQVTAPYLLTITEEKCFLNNLPGEFEPSGVLKSPSSQSGIVVKKHIIQTNSRKVIEGTSQYNELSFAIKSKCRGKGIFKATYKLLSSQEYSESKNFYNFSTISAPSYHLAPSSSRPGASHPGRLQHSTISSSRGRRRVTPSPVAVPCMMSREYKCARTSGPGCFYWIASDGTQTHIYDGEEEYCLCCTNFCPPEHNPTVGENCECDQITTKDDFFSCYEDTWYGYPPEKQCCESSIPRSVPDIPRSVPYIPVDQGTVETCITTSGASANKPCIFPFKYRGVVYNKCTWVDAATHTNNKAWCSTEVDSRGYHVGGQGKWGNCGPACPR